MGKTVPGTQQVALIRATSGKAVDTGSPNHQMLAYAVQKMNCGDHGGHNDWNFN